MVQSCPGSFHGRVGIEPVPPSLTLLPLYHKEQYQWILWHTLKYVPLYWHRCHSNLPFSFIEIEVLVESAYKYGSFFPVHSPSTPWKANAEGCEAYVNIQPHCLGPPWGGKTRWNSSHIMLFSSLHSRHIYFHMRHATLSINFQKCWEMLGEWSSVSGGFCEYHCVGSSKDATNC